MTHIQSFFFQRGSRNLLVSAIATCMDTTLPTIESISELKFYFEFSIYGNTTRFLNLWSYFTKFKKRKKRKRRLWMGHLPVLLRRSASLYEKPAYLHIISTRPIYKWVLVTYGLEHILGSLDSGFICCALFVVLEIHGNDCYIWNWCDDAADDVMSRKCRPLGSQGFCCQSGTGRSQEFRTYYPLARRVQNNVGRTE